MRRILQFAVLALSLTTAVWAGTFDGTYKFSSRTKEGTPDMQGWSGQMTVKDATWNRTFKSADGTTSKFYTTTATAAPNNAYKFKFTGAYKPEYVGTEVTNKIIVTGNTLTMESEDGKFKEIWTKQ